MSIDIIDIITCLAMALLFALLISSCVGVIKLIILWCEVRIWRKEE